MTSMAPLAGLGIGALFAGVLAEFADDAVFDVWLVLAMVMALGTIFTLVTPETAARKPGALASLDPRVSLRLYWTTVPGIVGGFMTMTLYMGLVPVVLVAVFKVNSPVIGALAGFVALGAAALASGLTSRVRAPRLRTVGTTAVIIGAGFGAVTAIVALAGVAFTRR
jgi:hypothetical protein